MSSNYPVYCALDTTDMERALFLAGEITEAGCCIKLGLEFFNSHGPQGVKKIQDAYPDLPLFLDLKYHDIPNTVASAIRSVVFHVKPTYLNVHAAGGLEMMRLAKEACPDGTKLLAVTILTSLDEQSLQGVGYKENLSERVLQMAKLTKEAGLDGVVCSSHEIEAIRKACGDDFILMVPGIRPVGSEHGDQKRVMTPNQAMEKGATHLVIGRPITKSENPKKAAQDILQSLK